jgi:hypothetical protein
VGNYRDVAIPIEFFRCLTADQLMLCRRILEKTDGNDISKLLFSDIITNEERMILRGIPKLDVFLQTLYHFREQFQPEAFADLFIEFQRRRAPYEPIANRRGA